MATKEKLTLTVSQAAGMLGISRQKVAELVKSGRFRSHQIGKRRYLLTEELMEDLKK